MINVKCKVYSAKRNGKFIFPEQVEDIVDINKPAICFSGGGCRAATVSMGVIRALYSKNKNFYENLSYYSAVSGGTWFASIFTFHDDIKELIGESIPIHDIDMDTLTNTNYDKKMFFGHSVTNLKVLKRLSEALRSGIPKNKCFQYVLSKEFLERYSLNDKIPVQSRRFRELNDYLGHNSISPADGRPFLICQAGIIPHGTETIPIDFTPMYSGSRVYQECYFQNQGFGCAHSWFSRDRINTVSVRHNSGDSCLESFLAASSAAYVVDVNQFSDSLILGSLDKLCPSISISAPDDFKNTNYDLVDGYFLDNSGILSLVARGVKKILSIVTAERKVCESIDSASIAPLFGNHMSDGISYSEFKKGKKIFHSHDWPSIYTEITTKSRNNEPVYFHRKLDVLHNDDAGVNGGYEVELFVIFLEKDKEFDRHLKHHINVSQYPHYMTLFPNDDALLSLNRHQVNILSTYTDWYVSKIMRHEPEFFEDYLRS